jgi:succinoglycan biosynthesis protein ExoA
MIVKDLSDAAAPAARLTARRGRVAAGAARRKAGRQEMQNAECGVAQRSRPVCVPAARRSWNSQAFGPRSGAASQFRPGLGSHSVQRMKRSGIVGKSHERSEFGLKSPGVVRSLSAVQDKFPTVTVVVPAPPDLREVSAVAAARALRWPSEKLEIIVVRGRQPAVQRNAAIRTARGAILYFLDNDSVAPPDSLEKAVRHFADPAVVMVGGPNLCPPDAPALERVFAVVLASWLAFGPSRARYDRVGAVRATSEKELILCNLVARREALLGLGGFDELLYPNEENALMDELQRRGGKLLYDPDLVVYRRPRRTLWAFARMVMTYGRGRAEQFRLHPTPGSALNFVPPGFLLYLAVLPFLVASGDRVSDAWLPLELYALAVLVQTLVSARSKGFLHSLLAAPLVVLTHLGYGFGFWRGLFTRLKPAAAKPPAEVTLERITS